MQHAKLAPSSASRRAICSASRELESRYPETVMSVSSQEGTAAHWVAQEYLMGRYDAQVTPDGEVITEEMHEGADLYEHHVKWTCKQVQLHIEERIDISNVHPDCWGTADCWAVVDNCLHVFDYKFGHGYVEEFENWQLLEYAAGLSQTQRFDTVTLHVVQPRCYSSSSRTRSWSITREQLRGYFAEMQAFELAAAQPDAPATPGDGCTHCRARHACPTLQDAVANIIDKSKSTGVVELTPRQTGLELKHLKHAARLLDARLTGLEEQAKYMIARGELVTGFKLEASVGREHWTKTAQEVITLGDMLGLSLSKPAEAVTPAQARKLGVDDAVLSHYSQRVAGKLKLIEDKSAKKVFNHG